MIGRITDGIGLQYCIPIDVYVKHHYDKMMFMQLKNYLLSIYCDKLEEDIAYITNEINVNLPAKLRKVNTQKTNLEQRRNYLKANVEWKEREIDRLLKQIKDSNKLSKYEYDMFALHKISNGIYQIKSDAHNLKNAKRKELYEKYNADEEARKNRYAYQLRQLEREIDAKMEIAKKGLIELTIVDKRPIIRKNAKKLANNLAIFDKDDDKFKKIKERHRLSKLYLSLLLEKTKAEASKYSDIRKNKEYSKLFHLYWDRSKLLTKLNDKYKENDAIKVRCMELQERVNNLLNQFCNIKESYKKLMKVINDLREQEAKAEEKYNEAYTKWDIISENRATLMGNLHKLTTDIINLKGECVQLQMRIDFCNMQNTVLEKISKETLGLDYL